ncbi:hypothetical protein MK079_04240 [Candidatus Gracilibacteria bacterium]|nr:hypothetical protein [Candidatus Gracilibacteria bacterium]
MKKIIALLLLLGLASQSFVVFANTGSGSTASGSYVTPVSDSGIELQSTLSLTPDAQGRIGVYDFNGNAEDSSGNGNHGVVYGASLTTGRNGDIDGAYSFDGINDGIVLPTSSDTYTDFSISTWINIQDLNSNIGSGSDTNIKGAIFYGLNPYFRLGIGNNNKLVLRQKISNQWYETSSQDVLPTQEWLHIVAGHDLSTQSDYIYINGEKVNTPTISSGGNFTKYVTNQHQNAIGSRKYSSNTPNTNFFNGKIDDFKIYNRALTQSEVNTLYQEGQGDSLIASYDLNGNTQDSSENSSHATGTDISFVESERGDNLQVARFNGTTSFVEVPNQYNQNFSLFMRYKASDGSGNLASKGAGNVAFTFEHERLALFDGTFTGINYPTPFPMDGQWHTVGFTSDGTTANVYLDGQLHASGPFRFYTDTSNILIGKYSTGNFAGDISDVTLHQRVLSVEEVQTMYQADITLPPQAPLTPTNFVTTNIATTTVGYNWQDLATDNTQETKYVLKDENNVILIDSIPADSTSITETGLSPNTSYQRKICAVNNAGESCSILVSFTTAVEVSGATETLFDFAGITIAVIETSDMFKIEFSIGGFKINFSIEQV